MKSPSDIRLLRSVLSGQLVGLLLVVGLLLLLIRAKNGAADAGLFLGLPNLRVIAHSATIVGLAALGMLLIIVSGGIDLSVGSVVALGTVVAVQVYEAVEGAWPGTDATAALVAAAAAVLVGGTCGLANGLLITGLRLSPFVTTLGMMGIARGLAHWLTRSQKIPLPADRPAWMRSLANVDGGVLVLNFGVWSFLVLAAAVAVLLRYHILGRHVYAIGSNEATARLCGVAVERTKVIVYTLAGLLVGWAAVLQLCISGGDPKAGEGLELEVIAAVVIGGAALTGGVGTVGGTVVGVLILGVLQNGVGQLELGGDMRFMFIGAVIILSTALGRLRRRATSGETGA